LSYRANRVVIRLSYVQQREGIERLSSHQGETEMTDVELTEIAGGVRELADTELAMVAGGGFWADVAKGLGTLVGRAIFGGAGGAFAGGIAVSALIAGSDTTGDCVTKGTNCASTSIGDAAL
jgi:hypothetical protein